MNFGLPTEIDVGGERHKIRTDYRAVLDIIAALSDPELTPRDKMAVLVGIFYKDGAPADLEEAVDKCYWFIRCGQTESYSAKQPKLVDWAQDWQMIAAAVNQVAGMEVRAAEHIHWWTFVGYYMAIGDSMLAQVVSIRKKLHKGTKLEKYEREFYEQNRDIVDIRMEATPEEEEIMNLWLGGGESG